MRSVAHLGLGIFVYVMGVILLDQKFGLIKVMSLADVIIFGIIFSTYNFMIDADSSDSIPRKIVSFILISVILIAGYLSLTEYVISALIILMIFHMLSHRGSKSLHSPLNLLMATLPLLIIDAKYILPAIAGGMLHILTDYFTN